ncbi:hypothetical protein [Fusobacterium varium]|jgi:hypothetical protein
MGKGYYLGGHTKISIYDEERALIKKIYRALHDDIKKYHITYNIIKDCFADYDLTEVAEAVEFHLAEREKYLEILIEFYKKHVNSLTIQKEEPEKKNVIQKYTLLKEDYIEGLKYDLEKLQIKIKKYPTNNSLKAEERNLKNKISALKGKEVKHKSSEQKVKKNKVKKEKIKKEEKIVYNTQSNIYLALKNSGLIKE